MVLPLSLCLLVVAHATWRDPGACLLVRREEGGHGGLEGRVVTYGQEK